MGIATLVAQSTAVLHEERRRDEETRLRREREQQERRERALAAYRDLVATAFGDDVAADFRYELNPNERGSAYVELAPGMIIELTRDGARWKVYPITARAIQQQPMLLHAADTVEARREVLGMALALALDYYQRVQADKAFTETCE